MCVCACMRACVHVCVSAHVVVGHFYSIFSALEQTHCTRMCSPRNKQLFMACFLLHAHLTDILCECVYVFAYYTCISNALNPSMLYKCGSKCCT